jgi:rhamnulokinase
VSENRFLACDLGAESGRVILGTLAGGALSLEELHRFLNEPVQLPTGLYWDAHRLFHDIVKGLTIAGRARRLRIDGIGVDTWGVDFGLLAADGALCDNPRHYRDARNSSAMEQTFQVVPRADIFRETGIQFMQLNSLYQLHAAKLENAPCLQIAKTLLFMPDLFNYWLTGVKAAEVTIASTSQFYNPATMRWSRELLRCLGIHDDILPEVIDAGSRLGPLLPHLADRTGLTDTPVFASAGHDTASAVAAVPAEGDDWCYISSGTWSLMGVELREPIINEQSLALNLTNEVGVDNSIRLLKNIAGLWVLQECKRAWALEGNDYSYEQLMAMAETAAPYGGYINPDVFIEPGHMPERIERHCREHGHPVPADVPQMVRAILEGLAQRYREVLTSIESLTGRRINVIHIVGGGSRNRLLNQLVADATGRRVIAGPSEATAIGNVLVQAIGAGVIRDLAEGRRIVRSSFQVETFEPKRTGASAVR